MSEKIINFTESRRLRFDFGCDDSLYIMAFDSRMCEEEVRKMLTFLRSCKYEDMHDAIPSYLEKHHLKYSDFISVEMPFVNESAMNWTDHLLHADKCDKLNKNLGEIDVFYAIMDYQVNTPNGECEGCYFAVKGIALGEGKFQYHIIGQAFLADLNNPEGHGCFAIRKSDGSGCLQDIDRAEGELSLPIFGCIDVIGLLLDIENIRTKEDAIKTAVI